MEQKDILEIYILRNKKFVEARGNYYSFFPENIPVVTLRDWYEEAKFVYQLKMSFESFAFCVMHRYTHDWRRKYTPRNYGISRSYVKKSTHKKKTKQEKQKVKDKRAWKKKHNKRITRGWWNNGPTKVWENIATRKHRTWEKQKIHNENWDAMHDRSYKAFMDFNMWD